MAHISLVLPFALPAPEFAADLTRVLEAPSLAALLSRTSAHARHPLEPDARVLPHELWIARALGLAQGVEPRLAAQAMRASGLDPEDGTWFIVNPAHIQIARTHLMMADPRQLNLSEEDGRALFDAARICFEEAGHDLRYAGPDTWFMRADAWDDIRTASPDAAVGMSLTDWMPTGQHARAFRRLQNDVQVTWFGDPVNARREARGQVPVNSIWPWGGASIAHEQAARLLDGAARRDRSPFEIAAFESPGWVAALASHQPASLPAFVQGLQGKAAAGNLMLVCGNVAAPAIAADWAVWLQEMQRLEQELFTPLLGLLQGGQIKQLQLVLSHRDGHLDTTTTPMAQRKFWRRMSLERLI